jgi:hypothetical protein
MYDKNGGKHNKKKSHVIEKVRASKNVYEIIQH